MLAQPGPNRQAFPSIHLLGVRVDSLSPQELFEAIRDAIQERRKVLIINANVQALNLAYEHVWFRNFQNSSEVDFCDGYGILLAARLCGLKIKARFTYPDIVEALAQFSETNGFTFYFLGARPGIVERAAVRLKVSCPRLQVAGMHHGYFDKSPQSKESQAVIAEINACKPDILFVGFGMPLQEQWLVENWNQINSLVALTGGAVFDYISGNISRAPHWMTDHGLEWLGRLWVEPRRLWKRYLIGNPLFVWRILIHEVLGVPLPR